jgi:hypothetical protein
MLLIDTFEHIIEHLQASQCHRYGYVDPCRHEDANAQHRAMSAGLEGALLGHAIQGDFQ